MEEELAMLRQHISQLQELLHLYGSPPPPPPPSFSLLPPPHSPPFYVLRYPEDRNGWCSPCLEEGTADDCCDVVMAARKRSVIFKMLESVKPPSSKKSRVEPLQNRGSSSAEEETNVNGSMDREIWQEFPEDLFEAVLARLPVATFFRFRSVCKKWNSLIDSVNFSRGCAEVPQTTPWFYTMTHENVSSGAVYDPSGKKWHRLVISALPERTIVLPVASAGGLVCFLDIGHRNFYVSNPLTKSFRELPARSFKVWSRVAVGMTLNGKSTSEGYKIMWVGSEGEYEVYDSARNAWTKRGSIPSNVKLPVLLNFKSQPVAIGNTLHFMVTEPEGILSYDMVSGTWNQSVIPGPTHLRDHTLAECGGRLMLVGMLTKNAATCVCVWELQRMTLLWKEVDRMPNVWCLEFYGKHIGMNCLGNKGCLLMLSLSSRQMNRLVTYNVGTREWAKVSGWAVLQGRKRLWITGGTAFHPSPTAAA